VDRDGTVWRIRVPEVGRTTQARTLREVEPMARDLIAIMDDIPADSLNLDVTLTLPADVRAELDWSAERREQAARSQAQAAQSARRAARRPSGSGAAAAGRREGTRGVIPARQAGDRRG
jgi:hypothetical protein